MSEGQSINFTNSDCFAVFVRTREARMNDLVRKAWDKIRQIPAEGIESKFTNKYLYVFPIIDFKSINQLAIALKDSGLDESTYYLKWLNTKTCESEEMGTADKREFTKIIRKLFL